MSSTASYVTEENKSVDALTYDRVLELLNLLGYSLKKRELYATLDIYGGAAMMLTCIPEHASYDMDIMLHTDTHSKFWEAVHDITIKHNLQKGWLNEDVVPIIARDYKKSLLKVLKQFGNLVVRLPEPEQLLAMKLYAARMDKSDLYHAVVLSRDLEISSRQGLVDVLKRYVKEDAIKEQNRRPQRHNCIYNFIDEVLKGQ
jgi:hypothetical protein